MLLALSAVYVAQGPIITPCLPIQQSQHNVRQSHTPDLNTFQMSSLHDPRTESKPPVVPRPSGSRPSSSDAAYILVPTPEAPWISSDEKGPRQRTIAQTQTTERKRLAGQAEAIR